MHIVGLGNDALQLLLQKDFVIIADDTLKHFAVAT